MARGRPTKYDPAYCEQIVEKMGEGYSAMAFAGSIGVSRATIYNWADEHPEFMDALKAGQAACSSFWETILIDIGNGSGGNAAAAIFALKNRAKDEWREKVEIDSTSSDGSMTPTVIERVIVKPGDKDG